MYSINIKMYIPMNRIRVSNKRIYSYKQNKSNYVKKFIYILYRVYKSFY